ncbi:hypothetical protein MHAE_18137 [Mycobacterium haemophilum DSM 44634]
MGSGRRDVTERGHQIFVDELARFAARTADSRVTAIAERAAAPVHVAVRGRRGVGCRTVARALDRVGSTSGLAVTPRTDAADLDVYLIAEVLKPEDREAIAAARHLIVVVLNKADLVGFAGDGPIAAARSRCAQFSELVGVPVQPMIGLLAVAALDDRPGECLDEGLWAALRMLAADPGGYACLAGSVDGFLAANSPVPTADRRRLLDTLDLFGTALAVAALRKGGTARQVRALLRRVSGVDAVVDKVAAVGAEVRYRRVLQAVAELEAFAVCDDRLGERICEFLSRDDTVVARMASAIDLAQASGLAAGLKLDGVDPLRTAPPHSRSPLKLDGVDPADDPAAHLSRAVRWQRYSVGSLGPVSELHRSCGADIVRGSLRLWSQAAAPGDGREAR